MFSHENKLSINKLTTIKSATGETLSPDASARKHGFKSVINAKNSHQVLSSATEPLCCIVQKLSCGLGNSVVIDKRYCCTPRMHSEQKMTIPISSQPNISDEHFYDDFLNGYSINYDNLIIKLRDIPCSQQKKVIQKIISILDKLELDSRYQLFSWFIDLLEYGHFSCPVVHFLIEATNATLDTLDAGPRRQARQLLNIVLKTLINNKE